MRNEKISVQDLNLYYGENHALKDVKMTIRENVITAFIGPSGCGKSTFLKTLNRMNDLVENVRITGTVEMDGQDIYDPDYVVVVDETLLDSVNVTDGLKKEGAIVINTARSKEDIIPKLNGYEGRVYTIDARKISLEFKNSKMSCWKHVLKG